MKRVESHVWCTRASVIGEASTITAFLLVKVAVPCRLGTYRNGVVEYRFDPSDPWTLAWRAAYIKHDGWPMSV
jgi:hypothetical protein